MAESHRPVGEGGEAVTVRAMNSVEEWGASDLCRLLGAVSGGS